MPRRKDKRARGNQHGKGHARPRGWHLGAAQGQVNDRMMKGTIEPAFRAADKDLERVKEATREHRAATADWQECLGQLDRAAPHVPAWEIAL